MCRQARLETSFIPSDWQSSKRVKKYRHGTYCGQQGVGHLIRARKIASLPDESCVPESLSVQILSAFSPEMC